MSNIQKLLLAAFLVLILAVILLTWGSGILTLAPIITGGYLLQWFLDTHDPDDFRMED